jgi:thiol:disulfide interchange protein
VSDKTLMRLFLSMIGIATVAVIFSVLLIATAKSTEPAHQHDYASAYHEAHRTNRPLIVAVGAAWCGPCREAERLYYPRLYDSGVYVHLDLDRDTAIAKRLAVAAVPAVIVFERDAADKTWRETHRCTGLPAIGRFLESEKSHRSK